TASSELPITALIDDAIGAAERAGAWSGLRAARDKALAAFRNRCKELDTLYQRAIAPDTEWREITQVALMVGEWGRAAAEQLDPRIDTLKLKLTAHDSGVAPEVRRAREDSVEVAEAWLALYRELHDKLARLAAGRRPDGVVLHARPVAGEIDYTELSREHIARYPKIRARLAE
ncbi:MAG: hypothetical protein ACREDH_07670, partial [Methylocella sp.]